MDRIKQLYSSFIAGWGFISGGISLAFLEDTCRIVLLVGSIILVFHQIYYIRKEHKRKMKK